MRKFIEIQQNIAWTNPFEVADGFIPIYPPGTSIAVDVTEKDPQPQQGWLYDPQTGEFSEPPAPEPVEPPVEPESTPENP